MAMMQCTRQSVTMLATIPREAHQFTRATMPGAAAMTATPESGVYHEGPSVPSWYVGRNDPVLVLGECDYTLTSPRRASGKSWKRILEYMKQHVHSGIFFRNDAS